MSFDENIIDARVVSASEYEVDVRLPHTDEVVFSYIAFRIILDRGVLVVEELTTMLVDVEGRKADIADLIGYSVDFVGYNEDDGYEISFENGYRIIGEFYVDFESLAGVITYTTHNDSQVVYQTC
jgi:hypothetical protein